eukprot:gnl/Dysnectes_brevis/309_a343_2490.p1 GENE.gnl/Dysnectes_brevis/309_a343_2490~~gnl/Dysnectes_brevis/309_a343_2490.p1  ORF type:complete len:725 (+),score=236.06 gnl/Dysnectes_brevis/309_a343_2490:1416-3590(+)
MSYRGSRGSRARSKHTHGAHEADPLKNRLKSARERGALNIDGIILDTLPESVYNLDSSTFEGQKWFNLEPITKFLARGCDIKMVSSDIQKLTELEIIELQHNQLTEIPVLQALEKLKKAVFSHNNLSISSFLHSQPFLGCNQLVELVLDNNPGLLAIPPSALVAPSLTRLSAINCGLKESPVLEGSKSLRVLLLGKNQLTSIDLTGLSALEELDISENRLTSYPSGLSSCGSLTRMDLSTNRLEDHRVDLHGMTALAELDISRNLLPALPPGVFRLPALKVLRAASNRIRALDGEEIWTGSHTSQLGTLDIAMNDLQVVPPELSLLPNITRLTVVDGNPLRRMRKAALQQPWSKVAEYLRDRLPTSHPANRPDYDPVKYHGRQLTAVRQAPVEVLDALPNSEVVVRQLAATKLDFTGVSREELPLEDLCKEPELFSMVDELILVRTELIDADMRRLAPALPALSGLRRLNLTGCKLTTLDLRHPMPALESLLAPRNRLRAINIEAPMPSLLTLDVRDNAIAHIDIQALLVPALTSLDVRGNRLQLLPRQLWHIRPLTVVHASGNDIQELQDDVALATNLATLDLAHNSLRTLPASLGLLDVDQGGKLTHIRVEGNRILRPGPSIVRRGGSALLGHLRSLMAHDWKLPTRVEAAREPEPVAEPAAAPAPRSFGRRDPMARHSHSREDTRDSRPPRRSRRDVPATNAPKPRAGRRSHPSDSSFGVW